ncbi:MAG: CapA family protein [Acidimicrobiales bacterium]|nr:CapA family protein [Acidimicrobiales bacterium]
MSDRSGRRRGAALVLATALVLGGCGSTGDGAAPTTTTGVPPESTTAVAPTSSSTTTAPTTTTTAPPPPREVTLAFAGDLLPHLPIDRVAAAEGAATGAAYDFVPMLAPLRPVLDEVDVAICHLEVPVAPEGSAPSGYPSFGAPGELVDAVAAVGYDGCSTASNHSLDRGLAGIDATLARMDRWDLGHAGTARSGEERVAAATYEVDGTTVAHLSYAYGFNGYRVPADAPWAANQIDVDRIHLDATAARQAGAEVVVVSLHWGDEYVSQPSAYQRDVAERLLPWDDIDLVVGHHAHVVQPIEVVAGTPVVWGLGNQLANQAQVPRSDGLLVEVALREGDDGRFAVSGMEAVPTWVDIAGGFRVYPASADHLDPAVGDGLRQALRASYDRTASVLATTPTWGVVLAPRP